MTISTGDRIPNVTLRKKTSDGVEPIPSLDFCNGRTVVLFGVPGAFTPSCSDVHLPGFVVSADRLVAAGVHEVACVSVNDAFVMDAWGRSSNAADHVTFLADGNGELAAALGLSLDLSGIGLGRRCRRFAAVVADGVIEYFGVEPGRGVSVSSAAAVLEYLDNRA